MDDSKHTPGPWVARQEFANRWRIEASPNGPGYVPISVGLACTTVLEVGCNDRDTAANAHLMAAAPELLEALKSAERFIYNRSGGGETEFRERFLLPAIAKAEASDAGRAALEQGS